MSSGRETSADTPHEPVASMTGSGSATLEQATGRFTAEVRSVNHRFLKTTVRAGGALTASTAAFEDRIRRRVQRGHVTLQVRHKPPADQAAAAIDDEAFRLAAEHLRALAAANRLPEPTVGDVLHVPGVSTEVLPSEAGALLAVALETVEKALDELSEARRREGAMLAREIEQLLGRIDAVVADVGVRAAQLPASLQERLQGRLDELLAGSGIGPDPDALAREVALLADRADVREETARLQAHAEHARSVLDGGGSVGRRLDFLVQEMHREANTIGSKISDSTIARCVVDLKADVERLREQVQNLE